MRLIRRPAHSIVKAEIGYMVGLKVREMQKTPIGNARTTFQYQISFMPLAYDCGTHIEDERM